MYNKTLSPSQSEAHKTPQERAEDVAYTLNHSLTCLTTDFVTNPLIGAITQKWLGKRITLTGWDFTLFGKKFRFGTCGSDHSHTPSCDHGLGHDHHHDHSDHCTHPHESPPQAHGRRLTHTLLGHTILGEIIGDCAAVPITIGIQRLAPGFTDRLRRIMEPVMGPLFRRGARRAAERWAHQHGVSSQDDVTKQEMQRMYDYEMRHLPQALLWTVTSLTFNTFTQKLTGNKNSVGVIAVSCGVSVAATAVLVVGARAVAPHIAHAWDDYTSEHVFLPATKAAGKLFGIKPSDVENMEQRKKRAQEESWKNRTLETKTRITTR